MASTFAAVFEIVSFGAIIVLVVLGLGIMRWQGAMTSSPSGRHRDHEPSP